MGIFGWSYPPGCSGTPADEPCQCAVCYLIDDCVCPECPTCGAQGDPKCYESHGLKLNLEQERSRITIEAAMKAEREAESGMAEDDR